jgi:hypothetical protein
MEWPDSTYNRQRPYLVVWAKAGALGLTEHRDYGSEKSD